VDRPRSCNFTIHDREDSADLMNLVRHELGFSKTESRFPTKGTCLAIYSRCVNAETPIDKVLVKRHSPGARCLGERAEGAVRRLCRGQAARRTCSITTTCCSTGRRWRAIRDLAEEIGVRFDHVLVDEYQDTNRLQSSILLALKPTGDGPHRGRR
jgi:DNA helicase-2/ATP-dependent DNA helicase PcrA